MNRKIVLYIIFIGLLTFNTRNAGGTPSRVMGWEEIKQEVMENNVSIEQAKKTLESARMNHRKTFTAFTPEFSVRAAHTESSPSRVEPFDYGIYGDIRLFPGLKITDEIKLSRTRLELQKNRYENTLAQVLAGARRAFGDLLIAQQNISLYEHIYNRREHNLELVSLRYEAGREDKGTYLRSGADLKQARFDLEKADRDLKTKQRELLNIMGTTGRENIRVEGTFEVPVVEFALEEEIIENLDYKAAKYRLESARYRVSINKKNFLPDINLTAGFSWTGTDWPPDNARRVGVNFSFPFFSGGKNIIDKKTSDIDREIAVLELWETEVEVRNRLENAYNNFTDAVGNMEIRKAYMEALKVRVEVATEKYRNGLISFYEWDSVENEYITARSRLQEAGYRTFIAWAELMRTMGKTE